MSARLALISDLHGNAVALEAVLRRIDDDGVDAIACLGDVATLGPRPHEVIAIVRERCRYFVKGNHDEYMESTERLHAHIDFPPVVEGVEQCRQRLSDGERAFLRSFSDRIDLDLDGAKLLLFHGSPDENDRDLHAATPEDELARELGDGDRAVWVGGHTHVQLARTFRGGWLVNSGSVGLAFARHAAGGPPSVRPHADYALIDVEAGNASVSLRRVPLDAKELLREAQAWDSPFAATLAAHYQR